LKLGSRIRDDQKKGVFCVTEDSRERSNNLGVLRGHFIRKAPNGRNRDAHRWMHDCLGNEGLVKEGTFERVKLHASAPPAEQEPAEKAKSPEVDLNTPRGVVVGVMRPFKFYRVFDMTDKLGEYMDGDIYEKQYETAIFENFGVGAENGFYLDDGSNESGIPNLISITGDIGRIPHR
jgi:hypothetical protein